MNTLLSNLLAEVETKERGARARARLVSYLGGQRAVVEIDGDLLVARCLATLGDVVLASGAATGAAVSLAFAHGDLTRPIITGVLDPRRELVPVAEPARPAALVRELRVRAAGESKQVRVSADEELVLECGRASITLRRDGRVTIKGSYVETYATGTNRIKGAQVRIN